ncbi:hypothetical protein JOF29_007188 [Kribbella aluminosa]|uniref:Uncharacterized protein n=1 Tax=Kribbella aluminosa TaxID=416017 RepID=A0ABS4UWT3_9ACTN|nr:hypothetical protein [Kribbella aluminosa]MBP2356078.1 hypothetical protein [Kribbella aluminosa]
MNSARYLRFWWDILRVTSERTPVLMTVNLAVEVVTLLAGVGMALALRAAANGGRVRRQHRGADRSLRSGTGSHGDVGDRTPT